ncbi:DUF3037 domain-containing protein [bacterium]|nr:DUF3037 domain-containing protein [bacterium]
MPGKDLFEYAVIRYLPRVDREEFMNIGIILYCPTQKFLQVAFEINEPRLTTFCGDFTMADLQVHLSAFEQICAGGKDAGPIGQLSIGERFRWLTAPRSTIVQLSPTHTGLCTDPKAMLGHLLETLVRYSK